MEKLSLTLRLIVVTLWSFVKMPSYGADGADGWAKMADYDRGWGRRRGKEGKEEWPFPMNWIDPSTADHHQNCSGEQCWQCSCCCCLWKPKRRLLITHNNEAERSNHRNRFITFPNYFTSLNDYSVCVIALARPRKLGKVPSWESLWSVWLRVHRRHWYQSCPPFRICPPLAMPMLEMHSKKAISFHHTSLVVFWRLIGKQHSTQRVEWLHFGKRIEKVK